MSGGIPLLPNEPRVDRTQAALTAQHLIPALAGLEAFLLHLRDGLDPILRGRQPSKLGKPYPLGQCLEISKAVQELLPTVDEAGLPPDAAPGWRALRSFQAAGGCVRQVWGDLRGQYFQNAFQIGTLYVDVSNDTVTPTKPRVEILPFEEADFHAIRDYRHYSGVAARYWGETAYPNHVLPGLAPHCPLIHVDRGGRIQLRAVSDYMLALTRSRAFSPSEAVLLDAPMPQALFEQVRAALRDHASGMPDTPEQGREQALSECRRQRAIAAHASPEVLAQLVADALALNRALASRTCGAPAGSPAGTGTSTLIRIGDAEYTLDELNGEVQALLNDIAAIDGELARLQAQATALQGARSARIEDLKAALARS